MAEFTIDCAGIACGKALHQAFANTLRFPGWYGANLDALYDCLTDLPKDTVLHLVNWDAVSAFSAGFRQVLEDAVQQNPNLTVLIYEEKPQV